MKRVKNKSEPIQTTPIGVPGLDHNQGLIYEEKHPKLQGLQAMKIYEEMSTNSPVISAALFAIEGFLRRVKWRVCGENEETKLFIEQCMNDMEQSWADVVADSLTMLPFGFALSEVVYKYRRGPDSSSPRFRSEFDDGKVGWRAISLRKQTTIEKWDISKEGDILGCWQRIDYNELVYIPMSRCVLFRTKTTQNNPEGRSLLRGAYRPWYFNKRLEEVEAVGMVRSLVNLPKFEIPARFMAPTATSAEQAVRNKYERLASLISKDQLSGLVLPSELDENGKPTGYKFSLVGASGTQLNTDPVIRRYDARQMMTLAAEFMLLGSEKTGSFALAAEKSSNFKAALERFAGIIRDELNKQIKKLLRINGYTADQFCYLEHDPIAELSIAELGLFLAQAGAAGFMTPTHATEQRLREKANLPECSEEEFDEHYEKMFPEPPEPAVGSPGENSDTMDTEDTGSDAESED